MELAHANRVATIGQLTASIAHEVKQPVAATVTNAKAALRWLDGQSPNLEEVRQALTRIAKDGDRAAEVIDRIRALIKRAPPRRDRLDINEAIREVIELTRGEAARNGVSVHTDLADGLPLIQGDRVELQQVILNLMVNAVEAMAGIAEGTCSLLISTGSAETGIPFPFLGRAGTEEKRVRTARARHWASAPLSGYLPRSERAGRRTIHGD
jgi:C4-dicarboxylate-specific signal transduction histidine kinase